MASLLESVEEEHQQATAALIHGTWTSKEAAPARAQQWGRQSRWEEGLGTCDLRSVLESSVYSLVERECGWKPACSQPD